jgi:hypothetical protein
MTELPLQYPSSLQGQGQAKITGTLTKQAFLCLMHLFKSMPTDMVLLPVVASFSRHSSKSKSTQILFFTVYVSSHRPRPLFFLFLVETLFTLPVLPSTALEPFFFCFFPPASRFPVLWHQSPFCFPSSFQPIRERPPLFYLLCRQYLCCL